MIYTDTERLNFLQEQECTRWVGYSYRRPGILNTFNQPVFPGDDIRKAIDDMIDGKRRALAIPPTRQ